MDIYLFILLERSLVFLCLVVSVLVLNLVNRLIDLLGKFFLFVYHFHDWWVG